MGQVKVTPVSKVGRRIAVMACVAILGVGATACGASDTVTPQAPTQQSVPPATATPPTTSPQAGAGF
jgi:hypothetical protein